MENENSFVSENFIHEAINKDLEAKVYDRVQTRFPPEPNGYLHIGHVKAIAIDFKTAEKYGGKCNLRFDDTNPTKEETEYVNSIMEDIKWLGFEWDNVFYASDYFDVLYDCAVTLIKKGKAYVCDLSADKIRSYRGTLTEPGRKSPYRDRSASENLELFEKMKNGAFENGQKVLRAKIDMSSGNLNMRDPVLYRILKESHHRTGDKWCIYPMYDFAHPISDAAEKVTHSLCTLEFEDHRPLYDWILGECEFKNPPRQIEFARLNLSYTLTSKRRCHKLVNEKFVSGWDDPRMSTISGMRRRGYPAAALIDFCERVGVAKSYSVVDMALLEHCVREHLNRSAKRAMAVLNPLLVVIENYPENKAELLETEVNPQKPEDGLRQISFSNELYIEKDDFMIEPVKGYHRLSPGKEVRFKSAYYLTCKDYETDEQGNVSKVICTYDPETRGGNAPDARKVKGTIHWVDAKTCVDAKVNLYDRLFNVQNPSEADDSSFEHTLNPDSLLLLQVAKAERFLAETSPGETFQFLRNGYFTVDKSSSAGNLVFNRTTSLKDSWAKINK